MSYIGNSPGVASQRVTTTLTATAGQTQFTTQSGYVLGYVDVYLNGAKLVNGSDFEAITGTYITLFAGAAVNDVIELVSYVPRGLSDGYTKAEADAKFLDVGGDTASGTINLGANGLVVGTNQLVATGGFVGIGTASPTEKLTVIGGNIKTDSVSRQIGYWEADAVHDGYLIPYNASGQTEIVNSFATGAIVFKTGTSKTGRVYINTDGNIGIGTSSPAYPLDILKTQDGSTIVQVTNASTGTSARTRLLFTGDASAGSLSAGMHNSAHASYPNQAWIWASGSTTPLVLGTQGTPRLIIDSNGSVGVGLTPSSNFSAGKAIEIGYSGNAFWSNGANDVRMSANVKYNVHATLGYASTYVQGAGGHGWYTSPSQAANTAVAWNNGMVLNTSGNLGIGNTNPTMALGITKSSAYIDITNSDDSRYIDIGHWVAGQITIETNSAPFVIKTQGSYPLRLQTAQTDRVYIAADGTVGIGTTTPRVLLDVNGTARFNSYLAIARGPNNNDGIYWNVYPNSSGTVFTPGYTGVNGAGSAMLAMPSGGNGGLMLKVRRHGTSTSTYTEGDMTLSTFWNDIGNVGIGTDSPNSGGGAAKWLTINGTSGYTGGISYALGGTTQCWTYQDTDNFFSNQGAGSNAGFKWGFAATDYMRLTSTGLGIGVSSPGAKLHIGAAANGDSVFKIAGQGGTDATVKFADVDIGGQGYGGSYLMWQRDGSYGNDFIVNTRSGPNAGSERLRVQRNGQVGIGTNGYNTADGGSLLMVAGPASIGSDVGRFVHAWWQGNASGDTTSYLHIRTSMWGGGATYGNRDYIMGGFRIMGYQYAVPGNCDQWIQFHNWSGSANNQYNKSNAGNWDADTAVYVDSTGYVTIRLPAGQYRAYTIDFHQVAIYSIRTVVPTAYVYSNSATI